MEATMKMIRPAGVNMDVDREEFALTLKQWRLRKGLTQKQVGDQWGISRWSIIRAEKAKPITWELAYRMFAKLSYELRKEAGYDS